MLEASDTSIGHTVRPEIRERKEQFKAHSKFNEDPVRNEIMDREKQFQRLIKNLNEATSVETSHSKTLNEHSHLSLDETRNMARLSRQGDRKESREGLQTRKLEHLAASEEKGGLWQLRPIAQHELTCANFSESPQKGWETPVMSRRSVSPITKARSISASISAAAEEKGGLAVVRPIAQHELTCANFSEKGLEPTTKAQTTSASIPTQRTNYGGHGRQWIHELLSNKILSTRPTFITSPSANAGFAATCSPQYVRDGQTAAPIHNKTVLALA